VKFKTLRLGHSALLVAMVVLGVAGPISACAAEPVRAAPAAQSDWRTKISAFASEKFLNPAWGISHPIRIYALAKALATEDKAVVDDDVLFAAAYLHDIAAFPPWFDAARDHSDVGADLMESILRDTGFPMEKVEAVRGAVRTHMHYRDPVGPEATYLHDADTLDWLGTIGAARMIALIDPKGGQPNGPAAVKMIQDNLARVPGRTFSPAAKAREADRRDQLVRFLKALSDQTGEFKEL